MVCLHIVDLVANLLYRCLLGILLSPLPVEASLRMLVHRRKVKADSERLEQ
jgi:hypothetical protein